MNYKQILKEIKKNFQQSNEFNNQQNLSQLIYYMNNPKFQTNEYYTQDKCTGYASIDKPHKKFLKKGTMEEEMPKMKMFDFLYERTKQHPNFTALNFYTLK